jgi:hypothetical protein
VSMAGEDFLVGLDRQRADVVGRRLAPVAGLCSMTAAGLARRFDTAQWRGVETALATLSERALPLLPEPRGVVLLERATIDLDTTDVVYGRLKQGVAYHYQG